MTGKKFLQQLAYACAFMSSMLLMAFMFIAITPGEHNLWPPFITSLVFGFAAFVSWPGE